MAVWRVALAVYVPITHSPCAWRSSGIIADVLSEVAAVTVSINYAPQIHARAICNLKFVVSTSEKFNNLYTCISYFMQFYYPCMIVPFIV